MLFRSVTLLGKVPSPKIIMKAFEEVKPNLIITVPLVIEKIYKNVIQPIINGQLVQVKAARHVARVKVPLRPVNEAAHVFHHDFICSSAQRVWGTGMNQSGDLDPPAPHGYDE